MRLKKTLVLGASPNLSRYSNLAVNRLVEKGHKVIPVGIKKGKIIGLPIINDLTIQDKIDTVTLYLGPQNQIAYIDYILATKPKRVIFNPGTINPPFMDQLEKRGVEVVVACTLVMLSANTY
ncbi:MAG: CoA-binding protein [Flavobacteriales bacterium]|nr:CoA-binding protein [Flavobacteriales bacterium]